MKKDVVFCLSIFVAGCNSSTSSEDDFQKEWQAKNIQFYSFEYKETGFTPIAGDAWEIQVADGEVIYVNYTGTGTPEAVLSAETAPTIDELFTRMKDCKAKPECDITLVEYDKINAYPIQYNESYGSEGAGFEVFNFVVQ
ncbi:DUF6174 domain-containing protein [Photobacterium sp. CCB-ST2H9]|uniref:DUF6174 domain-containing protein n=1 Tax=Photobacterium sp. CCB-ST2H9 TaxID=2912855 RepID=UPI002004FC06|nr:DUF6174 domain-containing protein [Photobacterium sp. CCB-ST2H9]UTM56100.1 DUF6174 domain-containing protein [Photobacterium sp. CCB-ST2H9]